ncbi:unnamed protein product [Clavelina lepadiformis]|uniref:Hexosyltransferase n=1 Tax=Clavelina lepadiformis TaxID=159417 RepID=A0ABP0GQR8_CLALP
METYYKSTLRTHTKMSVSRRYRGCSGPQTSFPSNIFIILKYDDDMMIDLVKLKEAVDQNIAKVSEEKWPEFPIICTFETSWVISKPIRWKLSKNYISEKDYRWPFWPKYCLDGFYTTSVRVIRQLWEASLTSKRINTDDVFITGILRQKNRNAR